MKGRHSNAPTQWSCECQRLPFPSPVPSQYDASSGMPPRARVLAVDVVAHRALETPEEVAASCALALARLGAGGGDRDVAVWAAPAGGAAEAGDRLMLRDGKGHGWQGTYPREEYDACN